MLTRAVEATDIRKRPICGAFYDHMAVRRRSGTYERPILTRIPRSSLLLHAAMTRAMLVAVVSEWRWYVGLMPPIAVKGGCLTNRKTPEAIPAGVGGIAKVKGVKRRISCFELAPRTPGYAEDEHEDQP